MRNGWRDTILSEVLTISRKRVDPSRLEPDYELTHWSIPQLDASGGPSIETASEIGSHKFSVIEDSVLYSLLNPRIPRFVKVKGGDSVVCSTEFAVLQPDSRLNLEFLYCFVSSPSFQEQIRSLAKGTTKSRERIDNKEIAGLTLKLPPLSEQKRIADLIFSVDFYIEALQRQLESAKKLRNAVLHELLTVGGDGWVETTLEEIAFVTMGQSPNGKSYNVLGEGLPFMQGSAEFGEHYPTPEKWCSDPKKIAEPGDLLLSVRAPVGDTNFADQRIAVGRGLSIIRANEKSVTEFIRLVIQLNVSAMIASSGTGMFSSITGKNLKHFKVIVPPFSEQTRIVEIISSIDLTISELRNSIYNSAILRSGLLSDLLSGNHEIPRTYDKFMDAA